MKNISQRNTDIVKMKESGKSQQEIAEKYNISRQRVQQIEESLGLNRKKILVVHTYKCVECKKTFKSKLLERKFCSRNCSSLNRKIRRSPKEQEAYMELLREKRRIRSKNYYHKILIKK